MKSIGYISTVRPGLSEQQVRDIVVEGDAYNQAHDITGVLVFNGLNFMQFIEGPEEEIDRLFDSIVCDDRHAGVVRIRERALETREFPNWAMAGRIMQPSMPRNVAEDLLDLPVTVLPDTRQLLASFASLVAQK